MVHKRWYDEIPQLQKIMEFLENIPIEQQTLVAQDMLQILLADSGTDVDVAMKVVDETKKYPQNRWYDKSPELANALEIIKIMKEPQRTYILLEITEAIYQIFMETTDEL